MLVFYTTSSSTRYRTFAATFEVMEVSFFQREKVLQYPGCQDLNIEPEEFVAEENLNYDKEMSVNEGVGEGNETIKTSNVPSTPTEEPPAEAICRGPLTFDPTPHQEEDEDTTLAAANNQVELKRLHYCLGHLPFAKLKQLARGSTEASFIQSRVTKKTKLQSSTSLAAFTPGKVSRFYLLPPHNGAPPSPPPFARKIPCYAWESIKRPMQWHVASPGECHYIGRFLSFALPGLHLRANWIITRTFYSPRP